MTQYKLVPVEPTPEMLAAAEKQWMVGSNVDMAKREWAAMLAAAPVGALNLSDPAVQKRLAAQWGYVPAPSVVAQEHCAWQQDDEGSDTWYTSCSHLFTYTEGGPTDNHAKFCCYCGMPIDEVRWEEPKDKE